MEISVERLDPSAAGPLLDSALELRNILNNERDPAQDPDTETLFRAGLVGTETFEQHSVLAHSHGRAVGIATIDIHHLETNTDKSEVEIEVHPEYRRRGVASAMMEAVLDIAEANGRKSIAGYNLNSDDTRSFWLAMGAELKLVERESRLWLADTDEALMRQWVSTREARAGDYRLEHYRGPTPNHLLLAAIHLQTVMNDAPLDNLDWEDDAWSAEDIEQMEKYITERGRERWVTIALGPNDEPAGMTALSLQHEKLRFALQGNTAVDPAHRNRGIGRWLKADMWLRLRADAPEVAAIDTENAASNDAMLAINVAMGFVPLVEWAVFQADVSVIRSRLRENRRARL